MSYYDIDAILTDAHKIPCTFEIDVPGLGYLDENPGQEVPDPSSPSIFPKSMPSNFQLSAIPDEA